MGTQKNDIYERAILNNFMTVFISQFNYMKLEAELSLMRNSLSSDQWKLFT